MRNGIQHDEIQNNEIQHHEICMTTLSINEIQYDNKSTALSIMTLSMNDIQHNKNTTFSIT